VGVTFKLVQVLSETFMSSDKRKVYLNSLLDLVALGPIADVVPVFGENRVLIRRGLQIMNNTRRLGLRQLKIVAGISQKEITSTVVGYQLSPRINVAGRMDKPDTALDLLCAETEEDALRLAQNLNEQNLRRQDLQREAIEEADEQVTATILGENRILILFGDWKVGLIGIIAGRLRDKYLRPVIVCTSDCEEDYYVGSARSFAWYDISEAIANFKENLNSYGGHTQAAGCSLRREHFATFRQDLVNHAQENISLDQLEAELNVDVELTPDDLCRKSIQVLAELEPFGKGNEMPVFAMFRCKVLSIKLIGKNRDHCKLEIEIEGKRCAALCWNRGEICKEIEIGNRISIAFTLEEDSFRGKEAVQMVVKDLFIESEE
jgi:single-stranded-DNA-specific exonuclease